MDDQSIHSRAIEPALTRYVGFCDVQGQGVLLEAVPSDGSSLNGRKDTVYRTEEADAVLDVLRSRVTELEERGLAAHEALAAAAPRREKLEADLDAALDRVVDLECETMRMDSDAEARIVLCGDLEDALAGLLEHVDHSDEKLLGPVEELMRRKQAARDALERAREGLSSVRKEMDAESNSVPGAGSEHDQLLSRAQNAEFCLSDEKKLRADAEFERDEALVALAAIREVAEGQERRADKAKQDLEDFDETEWVCPECSSFDTVEHHYPSDHSSRKCNECGFVGEPGEDFPGPRRVRAQLDAARALADELQATVRCREGEVERLRQLVEQLMGGIRSRGDDFRSAVAQRDAVRAEAEELRGRLVEADLVIERSHRDFSAEATLLARLAGVVRPLVDHLWTEHGRTSGELIRLVRSAGDVLSEAESREYGAVVPSASEVPNAGGAE